MGDVSARRGELVGIHHAAREVGADEGAKAPQDDGDESLSRAADALVRLRIDVKLSGDEEEVVADAVEHDGTENEERAGAGGTGAEHEVAGDPCGDAEEDGFL